MLKKHYSPTAPEHSLENQLADTRQAFENFAYIVAHDLNAPLRCISNFSQILEDRYRTELDDRALHYVDLITENSRKAMRRAASLLQYSRLDTVPMQMEAVECSVLVEHALRQLKHDIEDRKANIHVGALPEIICDGARISLLFYQLFSNALTFNTGRPYIDITARRGHEAWVFCVRDNGIGIEEKFHEAIFDVFRRLHKDNEFHGNGMGLALARKIVQLHDGIIWLESTPGGGSAFYFTIPDRVCDAA